MEAAILFEARVLQKGSLSNPTFTWGLIYPLRFHKTELEDWCVLLKKKSSKILLLKKNFRYYCVHIREILAPSLLDSALVEMFEPVFVLEYHFLSFMNPILTFQESHLVSIPRMRFATFVPSGVSMPFWVYCIRDRHICISNLISFYLEWASFSVFWIKVFNCF